MLAKQQTLSEEEIGAVCSLPVQSRVTKQVMRHWAPHVAAKEAPPNDRCKQMLALHCSGWGEALLIVQIVLQVAPPSGVLSQTQRLNAIP